MDVKATFTSEKKKRKLAQTAWLATKPQAKSMTDFDSWLRSQDGRNANGYVNEWIKQCETEPTSIYATTQNDIFPIIVKSLPRVNKFSLSLQVTKSFEVSDKLIDRFTVHDRGAITLTNCTVRWLDLRENPRDLTLRNCTIGKLTLAANSLATLEIIGGEIQRVFAPTPSEKSPFTGSVEIRDVDLLPAFKNAQAYRNLRHHLSTLHNHEAASVFHAAEMRAEFKNHSLIDRLISNLYYSISNYGGSSARPLMLFFFFLGANAAYLFLTDGVTMIGEINEAEGWRYELYGFDQKARALRAMAFSISQAFNPLGIFGTRSLMSAQTPLIAAVSATLGLASSLTFALFIFAVRRRFRLDRS